MQVVKPNPTYSFLSKARGFGGLSIALVICSVALLVLKGLNFGIDFQGGTEMLFSFKNAPELVDLRSAVSEMGYKNASIQTFGASGNQVMVRVRQVSSLDMETQKKLADGTAATFGDELLNYEIKPAGGLITVVLKAPKAEIIDEPEAVNPAAGGGGTQNIDFGRLTGGGAKGNSLEFKMGEDGKPVFVNPGGAPAKDRLVMAQDAAAAKVAAEALAPVTPVAPVALSPKAKPVNDWGTDKRVQVRANFERLDLRLAGEIDLLRADGRNEYRVGFAGVSAEVLDALSAEFPDSGIASEGIYYVGPQVGEQLRNEGILSVIYALLGILIYIALRFDFTFAPGAIVALIHDVLITMGIFSLFNLKFDLPIIAALLTIVGYSLNDTIVVYDRIREELQQTSDDIPLAATVNHALNACLSRTLLTSMTTLVVVGVLWAFGGPIIREFAIAMTIGVFVGTYSSMFVASPVYLMLVNWWEVRQEALGAV
jgi:preprotein translocase SecF subunit